MRATQDGIARYLTACGYDIVHLNGTSEHDTAAWVNANLAEGVTRFDAALAVPPDEGDPLELAPCAHFFTATKLFRGP